MGSESSKKAEFDRRNRTMIGGVSTLLLVFLLGVISLSGLKDGMLKNSIRVDMDLDSQDYGKVQQVIGEKVKVPPPDQCSQVISNTGRAVATSWTTKPVWFNMYQFTISDQFHHRLIDPLTNTPHGSRNYYVSVKGNLRRCIGNTQTVTCLNIHPRSGVRNSDDTYGTTYYEKYVTILRNPMTLLPSSSDRKKEKYHGTTGQSTEASWKQTRDEWFEDMWNQWKSTLTAWHETKYQVGMYIVYEDLLSPHQGPETLKKLGQFLIEAGFDVPALDLDDHDETTAEEQIYCLWYNLVRIGENDEIMTDGYEFTEYIPSFTETQKAFLLTELDHLIRQFKDDEELVNILVRYTDEIQTKMRTDDA